MKKLITLLLILTLALPALALAEELDFFSAYSHVETLDSERSAPYIATIFFKEDGTCFYCDQQFFLDRPGQSNAMIGTWKYTDDDNVVVSLGRQALTFTLHIMANGNIINTETMSIYNPVNTIGVSR